jgi:hypothetical protein
MFDIATINFDVKPSTQGSSTDIVFADAVGGWADGNADPIVGINYTAGQVDVVPIPAAAWLMLSSLGLLGAAAKRGRRSGQASAA